MRGGRTQTGRRRAASDGDRPTPSASISGVVADCGRPRRHERPRRASTAAAAAAAAAADRQRQEEEGADDVYRASDLRAGKTVRAEEIPVAERAGAHGGAAERHRDAGKTLILQV